MTYTGARHRSGELRVSILNEQEAPVTDSLPSLLEERSALLRRIPELGDFQPGSITMTPALLPSR
jgi:hypothetical protein